VGDGRRGERNLCPTSGGPGAMGGGVVYVYCVGIGSEESVKQRGRLCVRL